MVELKVAVVGQKKAYVWSVGAYERFQGGYKDKENTREMSSMICRAPPADDMVKGRSIVAWVGSPGSDGFVPCAAGACQGSV